MEKFARAELVGDAADALGDNRVVVLADALCAVAQKERSAAARVRFFDSPARGGQGGGFVNEDAFGYIPYLQLCVCYDRLGEREAAAHYNRLAGEIRPESPQVLQNRAYFASLGVS